MGNLQQALVCFEKRLVVAHELDKPAAKGKVPSKRPHCPFNYKHFIASEHRNNKFKE